MKVDKGFKFGEYRIFIVSRVWGILGVRNVNLSLINDDMCQMVYVVGFRKFFGDII